jgi:leader peptidase (prepilin peptidase) / N-methyltransferase
VIVLEEDLRPNWATLAAGCSAIALVSATLLPWPLAVASTVLGGLMVAGADVDARTFLLPDVVTWGTAGCGVLAAAALDQTNQWLASAAAFGRAIGTEREGLGSSSRRRSALGSRSRRYRCVSGLRQAARW